MTTANRIEINEEIYIWAIKESGKEIEEILDRFKNMDAWISKDILPTFRQVEELSNFLKVPLGYMFLDEPPKTNIIESEFRTVGNKMPEVSKELKDTLYSIGRKRDWLSEYRRENGWVKLVPEDLIDFKSQNIYSVSKNAKDFLKIDEYWYSDCNNISAFNYLRRKLEDSGIIVMQNGVVGSNNCRKLDIDEFRGFLLYDDVAPIIFINNNDSLTGKIFTLIHEYIHFLLEEDDIFIKEDLTSEKVEEQFINSITAEFLIPTSHIEELWDDNKDLKEQIEDLSKRFHVSMIALAIKLKKMGKIDQGAVNSVKQYTQARWEKRSRGASSGGNYYNTTKSRYGDSFIGTVIQGAESGDISYTHAFKLLDNSVKAYDYFKEEYMSYG